MAAAMPGQQVHVPPRPVYLSSECLTHDWNKYRDVVIATGGVDTHIPIFDIRNAKAGPSQPSPRQAFLAQYDLIII
jgi:peroxin-7